MTVWMNGSVVDPGDARVSVFDHGLLYGDGVFEGLRLAGGGVFALDRHMKRLAIGLKALALEVSITELREVALKTASAHGQPDGYLRLVVTRGAGPLGVDPTTCERPTVFCIAESLSLFAPAKVEQGLSLITAPLRRPAPDVLDPRVKSLNYVNNALAKLYAKRQGADDALLLNNAGHVAEASVANLFVFRDGELLTPPGCDGALEGITRDTVLRLAREGGIPARLHTLTCFDVFAAEEVFITGTGAGLVPVRSLDGRFVGQPGPGPVFKRLLSLYREALTTETVPFR